jgi:phage shock protein PspC (stress-responsive transcriptional regulator)
VVAAVLATLLAVHWGFTVVVALALALYVVAAAFAPRSGS